MARVLGPLIGVDTAVAIQRARFGVVRFDDTGTIALGRGLLSRFQRRLNAELFHLEVEPHRLILREGDRRSEATIDPVDEQLFRLTKGIITLSKLRSELQLTEEQLNLLLSKWEKAELLYVTRKRKRVINTLPHAVQEAIDRS